ncbi:MAG: FKBP-type peptidyl-prolyl cis-trans isomerase [Fibrobacterales bacterium]
MFKVFTCGLLSILMCCTAPIQHTPKVKKTHLKELPIEQTLSDTLTEISTQNSRVTTITQGEDLISYALGVNFAQTLLKSGITLNTSLIAQGFTDVTQNDSLLISTLDAAHYTQKFNHYRDSITEQLSIDSTTQDSIPPDPILTFFENNRNKEGIVTLESGLQYRIMRKGTGNRPRSDSKVTCHYKGTTVEGIEFESTYSTDTPVTFPLAGAIDGWKEALLFMREGAKWHLYIPPDLAYGDKGAGSKIAPNTILLYKLELLSIGN